MHSRHTGINPIQSTLMALLFLLSALALPQAASAEDLVLTVDSPTTATIGVFYSLQPSVSGGTPAYVWGTSGKPSWLQLDQETGLLTGTPGKKDVTVTFTLTVHDSAPYPTNKASAQVTINVAQPDPLVISVESPTTATIGSLFTLTASVPGGTAPFTWSATGKPGWLSLNTTTGVMSGTPGSSATSVTFTLSVVDKYSSGSTQVTINIAPDPGEEPPVITVASPATATSGTFFTLTPSASGGTPYYSAGNPYYKWSTENKPWWLKMQNANTGVLSGNPPSSPTTVTFMLFASDKHYNEGSAEVTIIVEAGSGGGSGGSAPVVTADTPTEATVGTPYKLLPSATGGTPPYHWYTTGKPGWLQVNQFNGMITGTPQWSAISEGAVTPYTFTLSAKDSKYAVGSVELTINVNPPPVPVITAETPTEATVGTFYRLRPSVSSGTPPYFWSTTGKPSWLQINQSNGMLSGTPLQSATPGQVMTPVTFLLNVKDKLNSKASQEITINVNPAPIPVITVESPAEATVGTAFKLTPSVSEGTKPYLWSTTGKPSWLQLNSSTGVLSGTPGRTASTVTFALNVKDRIGSKGSVNVTVNVNPAPPLTIDVTNPASATQGEAFLLTPVASGGVPPYKWSSICKPSWMVLNATSGKLSGKPDTWAQSDVFILKVTDKYGTVTTVNEEITLPSTGYEISVTSPSSATAGEVYEQLPTVTGGTAPYTWSMTNNPTWLKFDKSDPAVCKITGTPPASAAGKTIVFTVKVKDGSSSLASKNVFINVAP